MPDGPPVGFPSSSMAPNPQTPQLKKKRVSPKTKRATIKFTPEQHRLIHDRARMRGVKATIWMRSILLQAATSQSSAEGGRGYVRIKEPSGETT
jgi:hypothetical protein